MLRKPIENARPQPIRERAANSLSSFHKSQHKSRKGLLAKRVDPSSRMSIEQPGAKKIGFGGPADKSGRSVVENDADP